MFGAVIKNRMSLEYFWYNFFKLLLMSYYYFFNDYLKVLYYIVYIYLFINY